MARGAARGRRADRDRRHQGGRSAARATACSSHHRPRDRRRRASTSSGANARPGDAILARGTIGDHGVAIMSKREGLGFETRSCPTAAAARTGAGHARRRPRPALPARPDARRAGHALNEIAQQPGCGMSLDERAIPVRPRGRGACELLGLDPIYIANEGKLIAICAPGRCRAAPRRHAGARGRRGTRPSARVHEDGARLRPHEDGVRRQPRDGLEPVNNCRASADGSAPRCN